MSMSTTAQMSTKVALSETPGGPTKVTVNAKQCDGCRQTILFAGPKAVCGECRTLNFA